MQPLCEAVKEHDVMDDQMVSNTAFLIDYNYLVLAEREIENLNAKLNGKLNFKFIGPLPCYSFYTLEMQALPFSEIESARKELGLSNVTSVKNIKQAYLDKVKLFHPDINSSTDSGDVLNRINKAYKVIVDYYSGAVKPATREDHFSLAKNKRITHLHY